VTSEGQLLTSTNNLIAVLLKDLKSWRLRETMFEVIAKLGVHFGPEVFKSHFDSLFFLYLTDLVANVRTNVLKYLDVNILITIRLFVLNSVKNGSSLFSFLGYKTTSRKPKSATSTGSLALVL
jgi:hypothetical protein